MVSKLLRLEWLHERRGALLTAFVATATLWLAATGNLALYIHPRYNLFSIVACVFGLAIAVASIVQKQHGHTCDDDGCETVKVPDRQGLLSLGLIIIAVLGLLVIKPAGLSSQLAASRGVNSSNSSTGASLAKLNSVGVVSPFGAGSGPELNIKEWSSLITQAPDPDFFRGKNAELVGFVVPDEKEPQNVFYVSRYVLSCCAVDARPIGVAVKYDNWRSTYQPDQWLDIQGTFTSYNNGRIVLDPTTISQIPQPEQPYVY